jgi:hypothetical protein
LISWLGWGSKKLVMERRITLIVKFMILVTLLFFMPKTGKTGMYRDAKNKKMFIHFILAIKPELKWMDGTGSRFPKIFNESSIFCKIR